MPCYEVNTFSIEFKAKNIRLLEKIGAEISSDRKEAYWKGVYIDLEKGIATCSSQSLINELKQAYSIEAVKQSAKMQGWQVKEVVKGKQYQAIKY